MHSDIAIQARGVSKIYKLYDRPTDRVKEALHPFRKKYHHDFFALKDINFEIKKGETIGIIGKNGSGKSTLLKIISRVLSPSEGKVHVEGKVSALLELGAGFNYELTGLENIYFSGAIMGYSKDEIDSKTDYILSFADIGEYINQPLKTYSSGMAIRLGFAIATSVDPDILVIDEAISVGDANFQMKCFKKFAQFREQKKTILFITHALDYLLKYCDKGILLDSGQKIIESKPKETVDVYKKLLANCGYRQKSASNDIDYGNKKAQIVDFGIYDTDGNKVQQLFNDDLFIIKMEIVINSDVSNPVFAYTIKDLHGNEITGTNSFFEKVVTGDFKKNDQVFVEFTQRLNLQNGNYTLSLGCTNFEKDDFVVYHRLYDVSVFQSVTVKQFVGQHNLESKISIKKISNDPKAIQ